MFNHGRSARVRGWAQDGALPLPTPHFPYLCLRQIRDSLGCWSQNILADLHFQDRSAAQNKSEGFVARPCFAWQFPWDAPLSVPDPACSAQGTVPWTFFPGHCCRASCGASALPGSSLGPIRFGLSCSMHPPAPCPTGALLPLLQPGDSFLCYWRHSRHHCGGRALRGFGSVNNSGISRGSPRTRSLSCAFRTNAVCWVLKCSWHKLSAFECGNNLFLSPHTVRGATWVGLEGGGLGGRGVTNRNFFGEGTFFLKLLIMRSAQKSKMCQHCPLVWLTTHLSINLGKKQDWAWIKGGVKLNGAKCYFSWDLLWGLCIRKILKGTL